jgi:hypothetical protein
MKRSFGIAILVLTACAAHREVAPVPAPAPAGNPHQAENDRTAQQVAGKIAGHENEPAGTVFKNIQLPGLKEIPAQRLLMMMNLGYSRALGVSCTHCHVEGDFASDDKRPKKAAREMAVMHRGINDQLRKMENLEGQPEEHVINCTTCHRGHVDPNEGQK